MNVHWLKRFEFGLPYWIKSIPAVILLAVFLTLDRGLYEQSLMSIRRLATCR
jgi:hypothetical protein